MEIKSLDELFEVYGRDEVVPIDTIKQAIFYVRHGIQPELVWPKEDGSGRATFWFSKKKTRYAYALWQATKPGSEKINIPYIPAAKTQPKYRKVRDLE